VASVVLPLLALAFATLSKLLHFVVDFFIRFQKSLPNFPIVSQFAESAIRGFGWFERFVQQGGTIAIQFLPLMCQLIELNQLLDNIPSCGLSFLLKVRDNLDGLIVFSLSSIDSDKKQEILQFINVSFRTFNYSLSFGLFFGFLCRLLCTLLLLYGC
jgi:hypothetical protein